MNDNELNALKLEVTRLQDENDRLRRDRYEALPVRARIAHNSPVELLASEWVARTGKAEAALRRASAVVKKWRSQSSVALLISDLDDALRENTSFSCLIDHSIDAAIEGLEAAGRSIDAANRRLAIKSVK